MRNAAHAADRAERVARRMRPKKSISRAVYFLILLAIVFFGLRLILGAIFSKAVPGVLERGEITISSEVRGELAKLSAEEGVIVRSGELLATLRIPEEEARAETERATAERYRAELAGERTRALAQARIRASEDALELARVRERLIKARGDRSRIPDRLVAIGREQEELRLNLKAREELLARGIIAVVSDLDLRLKRHDLERRRAEAGREAVALDATIQQLSAEAGRLEARIAAASQDALEASACSALQARLEESQRRARLHVKLSRKELRAPCPGTVSWIELRVGETVTIGDPVLRLVPTRPAHVVAYPGDHLKHYRVGTRVHITTAEFEAMGTIEKVLSAARSMPETLLKRYQREIVTPAVMIRIDRVLRGQARSGIIVEVHPEDLDLLERLTL